MTVETEYNPPYFGNPLRHWDNPDLLYEERLQAQYREVDPGGFSVVDWPALRAAFGAHEDRARFAKGRSRLLGARAVALAGTGAVLVPLSSLLPLPAQPAVLVAAMVMLLLGFGLGAWHLLQARGHSSWLSDRLTAERLRAGYFQVLIEFFDVAYRAISDPGARAEWEHTRAARLQDMRQRLDDEAKQGWERWLLDGDLQGVWATDASPRDLNAIQEAVTRRAEEHPAAFEFIADRWYRQRMQVQRTFSCRATLPSAHTAAGRQTVMVAIEYVSIAATPVIAAIAACDLLTGGRSITFWLSLMGAVSAIGLTVRLLDRGLRIRAEAQRYWDYKQRVSSTMNQFDRARKAGDLRGQVAAMFDLERNAYWETRQFYLDHRGNAFIG